MGSLTPPPIIELCPSLSLPSPLSPPSITLDAKDNCERAIDVLNGIVLEGATEALVIKFADGGRNRSSSHGT